MPSESLLIAVAWGPWALGAALTAALLLWGVWPQLTAAWERAGLPRLALVWPEPEEAEDDLDVCNARPAPAVWPFPPLERVEATPDHHHDHLKEAA